MRILRLLFVVVIAMTASISVVAGTAVAATPANVAEVSIFSDVSLGTFSSTIYQGHTWLAIKNVSASPIKIGAISNVAPGETVTVGTWGNKPEHKGVWYNLEAYLVHANPLIFASAISLSRYVSSRDLNKLNNYILSHDSHGGLTAAAAWNNCSSFATGAWNEIAPWNSWVLAGVPPTPAGAYYYIMQNGSHQSATAMNIPWSGRGVYYGNGRGAPKPSTTFVVKPPASLPTLTVSPPGPMPVGTFLTVRPSAPCPLGSISVSGTVEGATSGQTGVVQATGAWGGGAMEMQTQHATPGANTISAACYGPSNGPSAPTLTYKSVSYSLTRGLQANFAISSGGASNPIATVSPSAPCPASSDHVIVPITGQVPGGDTSWHYQGNATVDSTGNWAPVSVPVDALPSGTVFSAQATCMMGDQHIYLYASKELVPVP